MDDHRDMYRMSDNKESSVFSADKLGTECYGDIEFVGPGAGLNQDQAKFVKIAPNTDCDQLIRLLANEWNLVKPRLLISVTGGSNNFTLNSRLRDIFRNGIIEAAVNTGAWIITGGTYAGVMKYIGNAVKDFKTDCRIHDVVAIGISTWGTLDQRSLLEDVDDRNRHVFISTTRQEEQNQVLLDPNHTHFILVDDGTEGKFGVEVQVRAQLERTIATHWNLGTQDQHHDAKEVPAVCITVEGGPHTIQTVYEAIQKDTPVIVVSDTGRAADAMSLAFRSAEPSADGSKLLLPDNIRTEVRQLLFRLNDGLPNAKTIDVQTYLAHIEACLQKPHLLNTFDESNGSEISASILKAVLKAKQGRKQNQLFLAQALNQADIAWTELFGSNSSAWKDDNLGDNLRYSLVTNQPEFVKLFLDNGVSLKAYLTETELTLLYNQVTPGSLLHESLKKVQTQDDSPVNRSFTLDDVNKVIEDLISIESMPPRYIVTVSDITDNGTNGESMSNNSGRRRRPISIIADAASHSTYCDPAAELFIYAIVNQFQDMAMVFWEITKEKMASALTASAILKSMSKLVELRNDELMKKIANQSSKYEELAIQILEECYNRNKRLTSLLLIRPLPNWGDQTCLSLAVTGKNRRFVAHSGVQNLMKEIWYFGVSESNGIIKLMFCFFFPFLIPRLVTFRPDLNAESAKVTTGPTTPKQELASINSAYEEDTIQFRKKVPAQSLATLPSNRGHILNPDVHSDLGIVLTGQRQLTMWQKITYFYRSPKITFKLDVLFYLFFLVVFSYVMLFDVLSKPPRFPSEIFLIVWAATMSLDIVRKVSDEGHRTWTLRFKHCVSDHWNQYDMLLLMVFWIATVLRFVGTSATLHWGRILLAYDLVGFYARLLKSFTYFKSIGPNIITIVKMFKDMFFFACILLVFLLGFGVATAGLQFPNWTSFEHMSRVVLYRTYFQIHGNLFLNEIEGRETPDDVCGTGQPDMDDLQCPDPDSRIAVIILTAFYTALCHILLLSLLVAMFSYTITKIQENTDTIWKYSRYKLTKETFNSPTLPPPLIIISHVMLVVRYIRHKCGRPDMRTRGQLRVCLSEKHIGELMNWESRHAERFIHQEKLRKKENSGISESDMARILKILNENSNSRQSISSRLSSLENQIKTTSTL